MTSVEIPLVAFSIRESKGFMLPASFLVGIISEMANGVWILKTGGSKYFGSICSDDGGLCCKLFSIMRTFFLFSAN
jgi:hypothetical protein